MKGVARIYSPLAATIVTSHHGVSAGSDTPFTAKLTPVEAPYIQKQLTRYTQ
ncbi:hypothetical protein [Cytobacillus purgationiresistens]|uniref:Uncharacterized protein n=1 Tax=Cytobacillus purgationiresistens TaxID=863449 RepID=A0ABU0ARQ7_9BACI|nr:hypothetical protein [Cytobacillus purgationiresistens]MDQ0273880.1 hypothetical protein [Cytobacillus purgationiresistens]